MFVFTVKDMRVSGQAAAVLAAVKHVDKNAAVFVNLRAHEVQIASARAGATALSDAITDAGFNPILRGRALRRLGQPPAKIPFVGFDHDFSASSGVVAATPHLATASDENPLVSPEAEDDAVLASIAGASRVNSLLPIEALGPLAHQAH